MSGLSKFQRFRTASLRSDSGRCTTLFAIAVGIVVLPLYSSQPFIGLIGSSFGIQASEATLATTITLLGYASGLFLLVPLTDVVENRSVIVTTLALDVLCLAAVACAPVPWLFFAALYLAGITTSSIQMLVAVAAQLSPEARRGRVVGQIMSGLMLGILFSRPAASLVAGFAGWRSFYGLLAASVATLTIVLAFVIPRRPPPCSTSYLRLIFSMWTIFRKNRILQRRALYQGLCMATFCVFWTSIALRLSAPPFLLSQTGIALFALAGAAGAVVAPIAGLAGDRGWTRRATLSAHLAVIGSMILAWVGGIGDVQAALSLSSPVALGVLAVAAVTLDFGVIGDQTLGRRAINLLPPDARGRVNGLFTGLFFLGAAAGSGASGISWAYLGWQGVCIVGAVFAGLALASSFMEPPGRAG